MLIPVFHAYRFIKPLGGGSTRPWLIEVDTGKEKPELYVMKLFREQDMAQRNHLAHEVMGSLLAQEFDLPTPDIALVQLPSSFLETLEDAELQQLKKCQAPFYFASAFMGEAKEYSDAIQFRYLNKDDVTMIFAFDMLIYNVDRNHRKPNLLFDGGEFYLIDHEGAFASDPPSFMHTPFILKSHLLSKKAKKLSRQPNKSAFAAFEFYLNNLNLLKLHLALNQIELSGLEVGKARNWVKYIEDQKRNSAKFLNLLTDYLK